MIRANIVFRTPLAEIVRFDHPPDREHHDDEAEVSSWYAVSFIEAGSYRLSSRCASWRLATGEIELTYPGIPVRYRHTTLEPDDVCLAVRFTPEVVAQSFASVPGRADSLRVATSDRTLFERHRLLQALADADRLSVEFAADALLPFLCAGRREPPTELRRSKRFPAHLRRIGDAVDLLTHEYAQQHSVFELARRVAMSPYHFVRTFAALAGCPPHRYQLEVRLRIASTRLLEGDTVTSAAFACGFQNLSHFVRTFHKHFGVSPGKYRCSQAARRR